MVSIAKLSPRLSELDAIIILRIIIAQSFAHGTTLPIANLGIEGSL
jgi:hypothetical protein